MKAISLWQPYASAIALGAKKIETRGWNTRYRGPLAIHAARRKVIRELRDIHAEEVWQHVLRPLGWAALNYPKDDIAKLPFGAIVAVCRLADCRRTEDIEVDTLEEKLGDFHPGRYGWILDDLEMLTPYPYFGTRGMFEIPDATIENARAGKPSPWTE